MKLDSETLTQDIDLGFREHTNGSLAIGMARALVWINDPHNLGWGCSSCSWKYPVPTLLSDPEAKSAYDRLAASKFRNHVCETTFATQPPLPDLSREPAFTERIRRLLKVGYKPTDAVALALEELSLEHRGDSRVMERARAEADDFLRKVRQGLI